MTFTEGSVLIGGGAVLVLAAIFVLVNLAMWVTEKIEAWRTRRRERRARA